MFNKTPYRYGKRSYSNFQTLHEDLQMIFADIIKYRDCSILCGHRDELEQTSLYEAGKSKVQFPNSKHNSEPSLAVDATPYPLDWNDMQTFQAFDRFVQGYALGKFGIRLRVGLDWNGNWKNDESFVDCPHFELHSKLVDGKWVKYE